MTLTTIVLTAALFIVLGTGYCLGWDYVKRTMPEHLVHYYLVAAVLRFLIVAVVVLAYIRLADVSRTENIHFALMVAAMYVAMMVITLRLKHN